MILKYSTVRIEDASLFVCLAISKPSIRANDRIRQNDVCRVLEGAAVVSAGPNNLLPAAWRAGGGGGNEANPYRVRYTYVLYIYASVGEDRGLGYYSRERAYSS